MEMKYVVPDMAQSFGTLEFAGESEPIFERDKNNRRVLARRSYNLYSDVQKGENVVVEIPVQAGEKKFKYEQKVKLVNPKLYGRGYAIGDMGHTDYVLLADGSVVFCGFVVAGDVVVSGFALLGGSSDAEKSDNVTLSPLCEIV